MSSCVEASSAYHLTKDKDRQYNASGVSWDMSLSTDLCSVKIYITLYQSKYAMMRVSFDVLFNVVDDARTGYGRIIDFVNEERLTRAITFDNGNHHVSECICRLFGTLHACRIVIDAWVCDAFVLGALLFYNMMPMPHYVCGLAVAKNVCQHSSTRRKFLVWLQSGIRSRAYIALELTVAQKSKYAYVWLEHRSQAFFCETSSEHVYWLCKRMEFLAKRSTQIRRSIE